MNIRFVLKKSFQKNYMSLRGWSGNDLAEAMGYKKQQVSQVLSGEIEPSRQFLRKICELTKIPAGELIETVFQR